MLKSIFYNNYVIYYYYKINKIIKINLLRLSNFVHYFFSVTEKKLILVYTLLLKVLMKYY